MYWQITPYHTNDAELEYAQARLEDAWDQLEPGMLASVTIELCKGDMPQCDDDV